MVVIPTANGMGPTNGLRGPHVFSHKDVGPALSVLRRLFPEFATTYSDEARLIGAISPLTKTATHS